MIRKMLAPVVALGLTTLLVSACGREDVTDDATDPVELLEHVPADTPYLLANLQRLPSETEESLWRMMEAYSDSFDHSLKTLQEAAAEEDEAGWIRAVAEEFEGRFNREGMREIGLDINTHYAAYGLGPVPVIRAGLRDSEAFVQALERIEDRAEGSLPRRTHAELEYFHFELDEIVAVMATVEDQLIISLMPAGMEDGLIGSILGTELPDDAFTATRLAEFNRDHDYLPYGSGFFDIQGMVSRLLSDPGGEMDQFRSAVGLDLDEISAACSAEYEALAGFMPRMVTGYKQMDGASLTSHLRLVVDEAFAGDLAQIAEAPVDIAESDDGVINAGMALDLVALRDFLRSTLDRLAENPPECETFAYIRENLDEWRTTVNRPIPPIVTNIHGFRIQLDELDMEDGKVDQLRGVFALHMRNPQLLFGMAEMFSPELAALEVRPGGDPVALPPGIIPAEEAEGLDLYIAMSDESIGLAFSEADAGRLKDYLARGKGEGGTLFGLGYDTKAYAELMQKYMTPLMEDFENNDELAEHRDLMEEQMQSSMDMAEAIRRTWMVIRLTEQGVEMEQKLYLD